MTLYTSKIIAQWLGVTERRVRQLRDEGILEEKRPGLYDLQATVLRYINYQRKGSGTNLNDERALLTKAKREAAETENKLREGQLIEVADIEPKIKNMLLIFRSRILSLPAKLSPKLAMMEGNQEAIFDELRSELEEALDVLSDYQGLIAEHRKMIDDSENEQTE